MKIYRARIVHPMESQPIEDGAVAVRGDRIVEVGKFHDVIKSLDWSVEDIGDVILMPGLINAHCHLDYTVMRGSILPPEDFAQWIIRINALKRTLSDADYLASIADGFGELRQWGCTTVFNIESFPELMVKMPRPPLRTWWFIELLDVRNRRHTEDVVAGALTFFESHPSWLGGFGLSPHAPYTTSADLYRLVRMCAEKYGMPVTTHVAETQEEYDMFANGQGTLYDFLKGLGRSMQDTGKGSPLATLLNDDLVRSDTLLAHMNFLDDADYVLLDRKKLKGRLSVVHCPNCHMYFQRPPFPLARLREAGARISIGTDSLASNHELNLFSEMRMMKENHPELHFDEVLDMATRHPAQAIGLEGKLGVLKVGAHADMIAISAQPSLDAVSEAIVTNSKAVEWSMIGGQR